MAATRTPRITTDADGRFFIDKRYRGVRIGMRVGDITQERAEERLKREMAQIDLDLAHRAKWRPSFEDCAGRYLAPSRDMRSLVSTTRPATVAPPARHCQSDLLPHERRPAMDATRTPASRSTLPATTSPYRQAAPRHAHQAAARPDHHRGHRVSAAARDRASRSELARRAHAG
jgi:hypothetical protein